MLLQKIGNGAAGVHNNLSGLQGGAAGEFFHITAAELVDVQAISGHIADTSIHFTEGSINHLNIQNIGINTHAQIDIHLATVTGNPHNVLASQITDFSTEFDSNFSGKSTTDLSEGTNLYYTEVRVSANTDVAANSAHRTNTGLDQHTQYSLVDGTRAFSGTISGVTPTITSHLATKGYVDGLVSGIVWQEPVIDKDLATPPVSPTIGDRYIVAAVGTGAWVGQEDNIAQFNGTGWDFTTPTEGFASWVEDEDKVYIFVTVWQIFGSVIDHDNLIGAGTNTHAQIDSHIADMNNPHGVTAAQLGAITGSITDNQIAVGNGTDAIDGSSALTWDGTEFQAATSVLKINGNFYIGPTSPTGQGTRAIALGNFAGGSNQSSDGIAIGNEAGRTTQGSEAVAIGAFAGKTSQGIDSIAIGDRSGETTQGTQSVAIGRTAGQTSQGQQCVAIGNQAGSANQGIGSVAIGNGAAGSTVALEQQGADCVAIGTDAGNATQGDKSVSVGFEAGKTTQGINCVAIGQQSGSSLQGNSSVAIGNQAGKTSQSSDCVAVGRNAGNNGQGNQAVAIGVQSGQDNQGANAVSIGRLAGKAAQGLNAIAIGRGAGELNQGAGGIIISATNATEDETSAGHITIISSLASMKYNSTTDVFTFSKGVRVEGNARTVGGIQRKTSIQTAATYNILTSDHIVAFDTILNATVVQLPAITAADDGREFKVLKVIDAANSLTFQAQGLSNINDEATDLVMGLRSDSATFMAFGGDWFTPQRSTNAIAALELATPGAVFAVPTVVAAKVDVFDTDLFETAGVVTVDNTTDIITVVHVERVTPGGDGYKVGFRLECSYANNQELFAQIYLNGVAQNIEDVRTSSNAFNTVLEAEGLIRVPTNGSTIEVRLLGTTASNAVFEEAILTVERIGK